MAPTAALKTICGNGDYDPFAIAAVDVRPVPARAPVTRAQFEACNTLWCVTSLFVFREHDSCNNTVLLYRPTSFHQNKA